MRFVIDKAAGVTSRLRICCMAGASNTNYGPQRVTRGRKDVTTAFIQRPSDQHILLVHRSDQVRSHKMCWGGVSGGVEGNESIPKRAETEILEEVGYGPEHIALIRSGRPLYIDNGPGKRWAVHPFLYSLTSTDAAPPPKLNWENVEAEFFPPVAVAKMDTVPLLDETLYRVTLSVPQQAEINALIEDREHGAAELAKWVINNLEAEATRLSNEGSPEDDGMLVMQALRTYGYHLAACRPSMAALANTAAAVLSAVHNDLCARADPFGPTRAEVCSLMHQHAFDQRNRLVKSSEELQSQATSLLRSGMTVFTLSKSSTIIAAISNALSQGWLLRVIVAESRPLCEGVSAATIWAAQGADVTVITDAQMGVFVPQADLVLVGGDAITPKGLVNKVGTKLLALAAHSADVPVYAIADTSKISPGTVESLAHPGGEENGDDGDGGQEEKGADEVVGSWPESLASCGDEVNVRNVYFETTTLELFTGIVTEQGLVDKDEIAVEQRRLRQMYAEAFELEIE